MDWTLVAAFVGRSPTFIGRSSTAETVRFTTINYTMYSMAVVLLILLLAVVFQFVLAHFTARDARERGHNSTAWFGLVLLFGVFSVLVYILTRNDRKLPPSDRPPARDWGAVIASIGPYAGVSVVGLLLIAPVGGYVAGAVYPVPPDEEFCEKGTEEVGGETREVITCSNEQVSRSVSHAETQREQREKQRELTGLFSLVGVLLPPVLLAFYRR